MTERKTFHRHLAVVGTVCCVAILMSAVAFRIQSHNAAEEMKRAKQAEAVALRDALQSQTSQASEGENP